MTDHSNNSNSSEHSQKNSKQTKKLWGGRFEESTDEFVESFTASIPFDYILAPYDIEGSKAHAKMLAKVGVLTKEELSAIENGLDKILVKIQSNQFEWSISLEDVHMNIEAALTDEIGDVGKKLHTGRSRNDQVATDIRLYLRQEINEITTQLKQLQRSILTLAEQEADTIFPGFTHLQAAQPITFGHHMLAWYEMIKRDHERMVQCQQRVDHLPLGSAALAGTTYPIDREYSAQLLGFSAICQNSLDGVSDRDFAIEFCAHASILAMHLSRFSEELIIWASSQFDFIELPDRFCTGSSIMPQKKNPDVPELVRGKAGRIYGHLFSLLTLMKSQPLAYNKDNQEDKEPLFDAVTTVKQCLRSFVEMIPAIKCKRDKMLYAAKKGYTTATDLADYLVKKGVPFRDSHEVVGKAVGYAIENKKDLDELPLEVLQSFSSLIEEDVYDILTVEGSVNARDHLGGTAPNQVKNAIKRAISDS